MGCNYFSLSQISTSGAQVLVWCPTHRGRTPLMITESLVKDMLINGTEFKPIRGPGCCHHLDCRYQSQTTHRHIGDIVRSMSFTTLAIDECDWNRRHFANEVSKCILVNEKFRILISNFTVVCFWGFNWLNVSICSGNGLAPTRRQAITWSNVDPVHWRIYAALGGDELNILDQMRSLKMAAVISPNLAALRLLN